MTDASTGLWAWDPERLNGYLVFQNMALLVFRVSYPCLSFDPTNFYCRLWFIIHNSCGIMPGTQGQHLYRVQGGRASWVWCHHGWGQTTACFRGQEGRRVLHPTEPPWVPLGGWWPLFCPSEAMPSLPAHTLTHAHIITRHSYGLYVLGNVLKI